MKLVMMTPEYVKERTTKVKPLPPPSITFSRQMTRLNSVLVQAINLNEGDALILIQDEERPKDFYLVKYPGGYPVRKMGSSNEMRFNCIYYWQKLKEIFKEEGDVIKFKVAITPAKLNEFEGYAILTIDPLPVRNQDKGKKSESLDDPAFAQASNL